MRRAISFTLNGKSTRVTVDDERRLLWVLRTDLGLTGVKSGCGDGLCGACTVLLNKKAVRSCATPMKAVARKQVLTIEGLGSDGKLHALREAFQKHRAFQCGYCTPGMILSVYELIVKKPRPTREEIVRHLDGNHCHCGSQVRVLAAVEDAAGSRKGGVAARGTSAQESNRTS